MFRPPHLPQHDNDHDEEEEGAAVLPRDEDDQHQAAGLPRDEDGQHQAAGLPRDEDGQEPPDGRDDDADEEEQGAAVLPLDEDDQEQAAGLFLGLPRDEDGQEPPDGLFLGLLRDEDAVEVGGDGEAIHEEHDESDVDESEYDDDDNYRDYKDVLKELSEKWIMAEIDHDVSKEATNTFWQIANKYFHSLYSLKSQQGVTRKIPQFPHLRKTLVHDNVPPVKMEIGYESKDTGDIVVVENVETTPTSRFPASTHRRLFEIASVDVSIIYHYTTFVRGLFLTTNQNTFFVHFNQ